MTPALSRRAVPAQSAVPRGGRIRGRTRARGLTGWAAVLMAAGVSAACSPPPSAQEPTGEAAERAWTVVVGDDRLDTTVAYAYSLALNSREIPTVVEPRDVPAADLVASLSGQDGDDGGSGDDESVGEPGEETAAGEGPGSEVAVTRTMSLAEQLAPDAYAELTERSSQAPAPEELMDLIAPQLGPAEMLEPAAATVASALAITSVTAQQHEIDLSAEADDPAFAAACDELEIGVRPNLSDAERPLADLYDCEPADVTVGTEEELIDQVVRAELDAAILTASHPGIADHALIALTDSERALPEEQLLPVVSGEAADQVPDIVDELAEELDDEGLRTLRRLIDGDQGLEPAEAAEYWLVEEEIVAEPEDWG